ncbi:hypothetical protein EC973_009510 [Apophysomyces ossiformis]|uniref:RhoGAP-domain-containing protein n=1 Tax=Apophysomyces ossiformis TaxID=679940 RepID=A0A8H7BJM7_9FUNG|nr:hypothetical protein EC973_009510 [Apophysomyces ossiformis]
MSSPPNDPPAPPCFGCDKPIEEGSVIAFGDALFHLDCFVCAKCGQSVSCHVNTLLLADGRPVCAQCTSTCTSCRQPIRDEAIMTVNTFFILCTLKGIHCTACHDQRKAEKLRKREDKEKRQLEKDTLHPRTKNTNGHRHASRMFNTQTVDEYMQLHQRGIRNPVEVRSRNESLDKHPPTPARSRSSSVDTTIKPAPEATSRSETIGAAKPMTPPPSNSHKPLPTLSSTNGKEDNIYLLKDGSISKGDIAQSSSTSTLDLALPEIPSLNLSFFDNDSAELTNLTKTLGANLFTKPDTSTRKPPPKVSSTTSKINKATDLLAASLRQTPFSSAFDIFPKPSNSSASAKQPFSDDISVIRLKEELKKSNKKVTELETNFNKIKAGPPRYALNALYQDASQRALDEFSRAKEEFAKESALRQQHEYTIYELRQQITALQNAKSSAEEHVPMAKKELDRMETARAELEKTCNQLRECRTSLAKEIEDLAKQKQAGLVSDLELNSHLETQQKALTVEIHSLTSERDSLRCELQELNKARDDVVHEMIMLNTKNAELTSMNNELSRRVIEREREAAAVMAGTSFLYSPSTSPSTELHSPTSMQRKSSETSTVIPKTASRDSFNGTVSPKMFKIKKKANMFGKLGKSPKTDVYGDGRSSSLYDLSNANGSCQSLLMDERKERQGSKQSQDNNCTGPHSFQPTSFLRPVKCGVCNEKMWGGRSEYRCQGCGLSAHTKCLSRVPQLCHSPTLGTLDLASISDAELLKSGTMFGNCLAAQVALEGRDIPLLVEKCIQAVEARAMDYEGIYRKSGGAAQMKLIQSAFEQGETIDLEDEEEINDICSVTSVLKQYLRELPDPLLTYELYPQLIEAISMNAGQEKTDKFLALISQLPKANYDTLKRLAHHLHSVQNYADQNLMTSKNLAVVFGPTLLRDRDATRDLLDMSYKNAVVDYLINQALVLFP